MKKFMWILAFMTALALLVSGCPGGGDSDDDGNGGNGGEENSNDIILSEIFSATETSQNKSTVTVTANGATFTMKSGNELWGELVTPEDARWDLTGKTGIKFEYKATENAAVWIQDDNTIYLFGVNSSDGWAAVNAESDWTELTLPFSILVGPENNGTGFWFGNAPYNFNKSVIIKMAFQIQNADTGTKFELQNFTVY